jgi:predicted transposase YbfD/YdcC
VKFKISGIQQVAEIIRTRTDLRTKKTTQEKVLVITNIPSPDADASRLLSLNRSYWDIENKLHYRKHMVFAEDRSTIRAKHGPANMATLRNFSIGLLLCVDISNIKRCVDTLRHNPSQLLQLAA